MKQDNNTNNTLFIIGLIFLIAVSLIAIFYWFPNIRIQDYFYVI